VLLERIRLPENLSVVTRIMSSGVKGALRLVRSKVEAAAEACSRPENVRLVAVSKLKPVAVLQEAFDAGARHFGENYVQELTAKAPDMSSDIKWHFIGALQSNKAKQLVKKVPNLFMVETVSGLKLANQLNKACVNCERTPLKVLVQVNTSNEESKSGIPIEECLPLVSHIREQCPGLEFAGLMTIGIAGDRDNFQTLVSCRDNLCSKLGLDANDLELSMGMSGDFELAIEMGSTNVRVGSTIFGARD
jgi:pyridoxal phosphate enzyme (YggS family)